MISGTRRQAEAQRHQVHQDLRELDGQVAEREIDLVTVETLRAVYCRELEEAEAVLAAAGDEPEASRGRGLSRRLVGVMAVAVVVVGVVLSAGGFVRVWAPGAPITGGFEGVARARSTRRPLLPVAALGVGVVVAAGRRRRICLRPQERATPG